MALTKLREDSRLSTEGWSDWIRAMVPRRPTQGRQHFRPRPGNRPGFICVNATTAFEEYDCGVYEWKAVGTTKAQPTAVVYIGSTCRGKPGSLQDRIMEYCRHGSHKSKLIDDALQKGYELHVSVQETGRSRVRAEDLENKFLSEYNYAWNVRNNAVRNVLP